MSKKMDQAEDFIVKFDKNDKNFYAKICWRQNANDLFTIQIFSQDQSHSGSFSFDQAKKFGEHRDENEEEYSGNVKDALKGGERFIFDIILEGTNNSKFRWKRKIPGGFLLHGEVILQKDIPATNKDTLIDFLINENKSLQCIIQDFKEKNEALNSDKDKCMKELEKVVDLKDSIETIYYGKFIQLLNSKKRRIQLLESQLNDRDNSYNVDKTDEDEDM